jgi:glyoxylase I family protein
MISGLHHVAIIVSSEASVTFYKMLGFQEYRRIQRADDMVVLLNGNGMELELFIDPAHPARATRPESIGLRHMALRVDSIEKTAEALKLMTGPIREDWNGIRFAYVADPDGLPVELHE